MTYNNIKAKPSIFAGVCLLCFSHVAPGVDKTIWQGQSGDLNIHWTKTDITATQDGKKLFSARALAQKDFQADFLTGNEAIDCEYQRKFRLLSVVGNIGNLGESEYVKCQGTAPPSSETRLTAVDFAKGGKLVKLTDFFAESDILKALLADNLLKNALAHSKTPPSTLQALYEGLEWSAITIRNCEYGLSEYFLSQFAFHHLSRNQVAIRLNLLPLTHACQSKSRQLGFYLPIPTALKSALNQANRGKAGFLMNRSIAGSAHISFSTTTYSPPVRKGRHFTPLSQRANFPSVRRKGGPGGILAGQVRNSITVQRGDTLFGIAKRAGCSISELATWNGLQPPYNLFVGQKLLVSPSPKVLTLKKKAAKEKPRYHTVAAGDTLYKIARRYSHSVKKIAVWNKLQPPYKLFVGKKLRVSGPRTLKWTWTHKSTIHPTLPEFVFKLVGKPTRNGIKVEAIESRRGNESQPFQTLNVSAMPTITEDTVAFEVEDLNFDGYQDMRLMESMLGTVNTKYLYWLFEPQTGRFVKNTALSAIISPRVDAEKKQIISAWRDGCCYYETDYYQVVDNKPLLLRQEKEEYDEAGTKKVTVWERIGGKMKLVSNKLPPAPEATPKPTAPAPKEEAQGETSNTHTVAAGDTLYSIARNYGQRIGDLANWNGLLPPYFLYPGLQLRVSDPSTPKWTLTHKNSIHPTFPEWVFKLIGEPQEPDRVNINAIEIRRGNKTQPFQTLQVSGATPPMNVPHPSIRFIIEDMNFDGYRDIRLMEYWPMRQSLWHPIPNIEYSYWLFDPKTGRFVSSLAFNAAKLGSPEFESEKKQIISHWETGCCEYGFDYYNIVNDKPLLVRQKKYEVDEATGTKKETVLARVVGGEMKLLSETVPPKADKPAEEAETVSPEADKPADESETVSPKADKPADDSESETVPPKAEDTADKPAAKQRGADKPADDSAVSPKEEPEKQWLITKKPVTVHTAPNATVVVQLQIGTIVKQLARSDAQEKNGDSQHDWYHIEMADGKQGWILGHLTMSFDPEEKANLYRQIAQAQPLSLSEQTELTDFLARATEEVQSPPEMAAELALLHLLSLRKSIDQFDWKAYPVISLDKTAEKPLPSDYKTWLKKQLQERHIYHDDVQSTAAGHSVWHLHAHLFWKLHDKYYPLPITDRIAWAGARNSVGGICYGYFECDLRNLEDTTMSYLKYHPTGKYVAEALEEMATVLDNIIDQNQVLFESKESLKWLRHFAVLRATVERTTHPKKAQVLGKIDKLQLSVISYQ